MVCHGGFVGVIGDVYHHPPYGVPKLINSTDRHQTIVVDDANEVTEDFDLLDIVRGEEDRGLLDWGYPDQLPQGMPERGSRPAMGSSSTSSAGTIAHTVDAFFFHLSDRSCTLRSI